MGEEVELYGAMASAFSCRVEIFLKLKGVEYKYHEEDLRNKSASLLKYNPIHKKVPAFVHNQKPLAESLLILEYIDETWNTNPIFPQDPYERAQARFWTRFIDDKIVPILREAWVKEDREKEAKEASEYLEFLEKELKGKFFGGESIGVVDIAGNVIAQWLPVFQQLMGVEIMTETKFPKLCKWSHDFATHPMVKDVLPSKEQLIAFYKPQL